MAQGRRSATLVPGLGLLFFLLMIQMTAPIVGAATYLVGDGNGWTFNAVNWPNGKTFRAGDILVFNYNPLSHNVVAVDGNGYNGCAIPTGARVFTSGNDRITLGRGPIISSAATLTTASPA
uniref:Phytocyanin domain-containing protein n=1 Tax=Ananas comosus var. bracteatus TaxID=296719 RepID=A0A6V7Q3D7_ANACO|nr:unnamed protein product [Ananas comosus var. bracteatus]